MLLVIKTVTEPVPLAESTTEAGAMASLNKMPASMSLPQKQHTLLTNLIHCFILMSFTHTHKEKKKRPKPHNILHFCDHEKGDSECNRFRVKLV